MKRKIIASIWFSLSLLMLCGEPQTKIAMLWYILILLNFVASALYVNYSFKTKNPEICQQKY